jgi:hypothetical protein
MTIALQTNVPLKDARAVDRIVLQHRFDDAGLAIA